MSRLRHTRCIPNRSEENWELKKNCFLENRHLEFSGSSEIVFRRLVASTKCCLEFQFLNARTGTGVIVVFYPLSDKFELTSTSKLIVELVDIGIESIATVEIGHTRRQFLKRIKKVSCPKSLFCSNVDRI